MRTLDRPTLSHAEILEAWTSSEQDIHVNQHGAVFYCGRNILAADANGNPDFPAIKAWCDRENYWPNVWHTNERGNVELYTLDGESVGGLV